MPFRNRTIIKLGLITDLKLVLLSFVQFLINFRDSVILVAGEFSQTKILAIDEIDYFSGKQLKTEGDNFRQKLNTQPLFDEWVEIMSKKNLAVPNRVSLRFFPRRFKEKI